MAAASTSGTSRTRAHICLGLLVLLAFSLGCSEFAVIGIESDLASDLGVSLAAAGQLISLFALPYAVMTPVLALSCGRFRRYSLLLAYSLIFCAGNIISALAGGFAVLLISRILIGSVSGALLAVGLTFIPELTTPEKSSWALSLVYAAYSVAMVVATSAGKFVADVANWHVFMYGVLALAVITCSLCLAILPRQGATDEPATFREQAGLFREPQVLAAMLIFVFGVGSVYTFYGYVTPYLETILHMDTVAASTTLMAYGAVTFISNLAGGWIDARFGVRALIVAFLAQAAVLLGIFISGQAAAPALALIFALALLMYLASVPCVSLFMAAARKRHPKALTLASSLEPMSFNVGIAFGTAVGGSVVTGLGLPALGLVGAALSVLAAATAAVTAMLQDRHA